MVKGRIALLGRGKFSGEKGQRLPATGDQLLEDAADVGFRCISSQGERGSGMRIG